MVEFFCGDVVVCLFLSFLYIAPNRAGCGLMKIIKCILPIKRKKSINKKEKLKVKF